MDKISIKIWPLKYILTFITINFFIFFLIFYLFSFINTNYRDQFDTKIELKLQKTAEYNELNNFLYQAFQDVALSDYFFQENILNLNLNDHQFNLDNQYRIFFNNVSRSIFLDLFRPYELSEKIEGLNFYSSDNLNVPGSFSENFLEISFKSKNNITDEVLIEISKIIDFELNIMIKSIISKLEYYNSRNIKINDFLKKNKMLEISNSKYGDFFIKANIQNIKKLIDKKISIILRPKMLSKSIFVDFNDPINSVFFTSLIFSIILNLIIFYIFYMLKHVFIFKF